MSISCCVFKSCYMCVPRCLPGLRSVAVQDLVGSDQVQFPMTLLKHVDPRQPTGRGDQSLLHGRWIHQLPVQDGARGQKEDNLCYFCLLVSSFSPYDPKQCKRKEEGGAGIHMNVIPQGRGRSGCLSVRVV